MGNIAGATTIESYYNALVDYIELYSELFAEYVTITGGTTENPISITYNATEIELNSYGNRIIGIIGGVLLNDTPPSSSNGESSNDSSSEGPDIPVRTDGLIIPEITNAFTTWFKEFNYENAMMISGDVWVSEDEINESSLYKVKSISILNSCKFINPVKTDIIYNTDHHYSTLNDVKNLLTDQYNTLTNINNMILSVISSVNSLRSYYSDVIMSINSNAMYASNADFVSHQYYTDSYAYTAVNSWAPMSGRAMGTAESVVPGIITDTKNSIDDIISQVEEVNPELESNNAISMLESLKSDINDQYLSHYIENYGNRIALIISQLMSALPEDYDYTLTDKLATIEQNLESTVLNTLSRYTVYSKFGPAFIEGSDIRSNHTGLLNSLKSAVGNLNAVSN